MNQSCDILYIHSIKNPLNRDQTQYAIMPMGIIAILNGLKAGGYTVHGINLAIEMELDPQFSLAALLQDTQYKILMTDLHWYEHAFGAIYVAELSKQIWPNRPTVLGGYTSTIYGPEILENFPAVDYIVTGDSDLPLEQLVGHLTGRSDLPLHDIANLVYRDAAGIAVSEKTWVQTTLDDLDFVSADFFRHSEYLPRLSVHGASRKKLQRWIGIARGCHYNCAYCCGARDNMNALFRRCNVLLRSPEKVAADFIALAAEGIQVAPSHDLQMFGQAYYREIFAQIRKSGVKPGMYLECFQLPSQDFIDEAAKTFDTDQLILEISPISGNEQLRRENGKQFSNEQLYDTVQYIRSKGISVQLYYTVNVVGETGKQFEDTLFQMKYLRTVLNIRSVFYQRIVIDPLAGMRAWDGVNAQYNTFMDYYRYCQLPQDEKMTATGFDDQGELLLEKKLQLYKAIFGKA